MTAAGLALALPLGGVARADLNRTVLDRLNLDAATTEKVKAYDAYRAKQEKQEDQARKAVRFAKKQIGKPYRWGAEGPNAYDCSGLVMAAWRKAGVKIPRVTHAQYRRIDRKVKLKNLKKGDLIFFRNRGHVGMYVGNDRYLHAPNSGSRVRINKLTKSRKKQFAGAVRPGAPEKREFPLEIRNLAEKIDRLSEKPAEAPPDKTRTPDTPHSAQNAPHHPRKPPIGSPAGDAQHAAPPARPGKPTRPAPAKNPPSEQHSGKMAAKPAGMSHWPMRPAGFDSWHAFASQTASMTASIAASMTASMTAPGHRPH
ncbi:C40 family peptidase [Actinomadura sp. WMMB 499]|uniref:C40 family peptidase n=1 Tax=Actinomadura sp. WMMB 499 TaxID=1219491 RepID=UPI00159E873F|nr:C40 family peptidase [Actinomadura sp. WMMB 499]